MTDHKPSVNIYLQGKPFDELFPLFLIGYNEPL
jgi:hypothetical protein